MQDHFITFILFQLSSFLKNMLCISLCVYVGSLRVSVLFFCNSILGKYFYSFVGVPECNFIYFSSYIGKVSTVGH